MSSKRSLAYLLLAVLLVPGQWAVAGADSGCDCRGARPDLLGARAPSLDGALPSPSDSAVVLDMFVMSLCPYAMEAQAAVLPVVAGLGGRVDLRIHYLAEVAARDTAGGRAERTPDSGAPTAPGGGGAFRSLHGPEEVAESLRQLAVQTDHPEMYLPYMLCRARSGPGGDWRACAQAVGLDAQAVARAAARDGTAAQFRANIATGLRLGIQLSPTLYIDGEEYAGDYTEHDVAERLCATAGDVEYCSQRPACWADVDCPTVAGQVAVCVDAGTPAARCQTHPPVPFSLFVLNSRDCPECSTGAFVRSTLELFPGAQVEGFLVESPEGAELASRYAVEVLPAYVFGPGFERTARFARVAAMVTPQGDGYVVAPRLTSVSYWPGREPMPGRTEVYVPLGPSAAEAAYLAGWLDGPPGMEIRHLAQAVPPGQGPVPEDVAWRVCAAGAAPELYPHLVQAVGASPPSAWRGVLEHLGAPVDPVVRCVAAGGAGSLLAATRVRADSLQLVVGDVAALLDNQLLLRRPDPHQVAALRR